jgi:phage terminase small subunit
MDGLNEKQQAFCREYIIDFNGTQAAIRAGYSEKTANEQASQLLAKLNVKQEIDKLIANRREDTWLTAKKVLDDIEKIKQDAMRTKADANGNTEMINHNAALKACELHGKHLAMWVEKTEVTGANGTPIQFETAPKLSKEEWLKAHGIGVK